MVEGAFIGATIEEYAQGMSEYEVLPNQSSEPVTVALYILADKLNLNPLGIR